MDKIGWLLKGEYWDILSGNEGPSSQSKYKSDTNTEKFDYSGKRKIEFALARTSIFIWDLQLMQVDATIFHQTGKSKVQLRAPGLKVGMMKQT